MEIKKYKKAAAIPLSKISIIVCFCRKSTFFVFFCRAVGRIVEEPARAQKLQAEVYMPIALECQKDMRSIEKNLRTVRDVFMRNGGAELLVKISGGDYWRQINPSVGDLISIFAYYFIKEQSNAGHI